MRHKVVNEHTLLKKLRRANRDAAFEVPVPSPGVLPGFGELGLRLFPRLTQWQYFCSPLNAWTFADTGGDGVHFSFLAKDDRIGPLSPVIVTVPTHCQNYVVGEDLYDFLCLGMYRGYFALEALAVDEDITVQACINPDWVMPERVSHAFDTEMSEYKQSLLRFMTKRFQLQPWTDVNRFETLQTRFGGEMQLPPEFT